MNNLQPMKINTHVVVDQPPLLTAVSCGVREKTRLCAQGVGIELRRQRTGKVARVPMDTRGIEGRTTSWRGRGRESAACAIKNMFKFVGPGHISLLVWQHVKSTQLARHCRQRTNWAGGPERKQGVSPKLPRRAERGMADDATICLPRNRTSAKEEAPVCSCGKRLYIPVRRNKAIDLPWCES